MITVDNMKNMFMNMSEEIINNEHYLTEIDTIIGDGDHGIGMKRGFSAVQVKLKGMEFIGLEVLVKTTGIELLKTMGGTSGVIFGTMFIGGAELLNEKYEISIDELANYFEAGCVAIQRRGGAKAGQKTMLDALIPAVNSLKESAEMALETELALEKAYKAALNGVEETKEMKAKTGRSKNFQERTIGWPDPGAISISLIFKAFYKSYET